MDNIEEIITERKKCFRAYTLLVSALFNYATSKDLFEKRSYSWELLHHIIHKFKLLEW